MQQNSFQENSFIAHKEKPSDVQRERACKDKNSRHETKRPKNISAAFFCLLGVLTILAWIIPIRPTVSISEKRNLEKFPLFSSETLLSGEYFKSIELWFSDTFTFRETWIRVAEKLEKLSGIQDVTIYGEIPVVDSVPVPVENLNEITDQFGDTLHQYNVEVLEEDEFENDEEQEEWGGLVIADDELIADRGSKLQIGDSVFVYPGFNKNNAELYASKMNKAAEKLESIVNVYSIIVPENVSSVLSREDREKYGFVIEEDSISYIYSLMSEKVKPVYILPNLQKHNNEYIVFRSDHHWTAVGAYYAYEAWCNVSGKEPVPLSEYKEYAWTDFLGSYYNTSGKPKEIRNNPDTVYAYEPPGDVHLYLDFTNSLNKKGEEVPLLVDRSNKKGDQYMTFLSTDAAKATFINNDIDDDSAVLVYKTSFGNPFVYYLTQHYHYVIVADVRYIKYSASKFAKTYNIDDVIVIHDTAICYSNNGMDIFFRLLK